MRSLTLLLTTAAVAAFAFAVPADAKSAKRSQAMAQDQSMRSNAMAPDNGPWFYAQANSGCFKETNKDWGFGYAGECSAAATAANISRVRDQRLTSGGQ